MNEEFEKWAEQEGYNLSKVHGRYTHSNTRDVLIGWQKRQAEIDAYREDSVRLSGIIDNWKERCDMQGMRIQELAAENERLRKEIKNVEREEVFPVYAKDEKLREVTKEFVRAYDRGDPVVLINTIEKMREALEGK